MELLETLDISILAVTSIAISLTLVNIVCMVVILYDKKVRYNSKSRQGSL